ncbi:hypothetical protein BLA60_20790 [Actinophytocola xinjiangensis]|uniref:Uncharacterized protein n=1 Tax=Actinophytocola xinjiangensis TaxID=485602 RepID=A0A7Z1AXD0_9PSEU|nr:hypothetical protein [Actinophytocola xinjiangensis]OLF09028.1 hypothetical protein BLA60_20790 [Actinophytocola xinjiangensis]
MAQAVRLLHLTGKPAVDYGQFHLFDVESHRYSLLDLTPPTDGTIGVSGDGGARFFTLGEMTDVVVEFELWSAEPDGPEQQYLGEFTIDTGRVVLGSTTGSPNDVLIDLPQPGAYQIRAFRHSQAVIDSEFSDLNHHEETWLIQVWPRWHQVSV